VVAGSVTLADPATADRTVVAPIAPGVVARSPCVRFVSCPSACPSGSVESGTVALDGEREIEVDGTTPVTVTLAHDGLRVLDARATLAEAAARRLLVHQPDALPTLQEV
jgi:hypothetical protein